MRRRSLQSTAPESLTASHPAKLEQGWGLASEPARAPRPVAVGPEPMSRRLTSEQIDDGWFLPDEPAVSAPPLLDVNTATAEQLCGVPGIGRLRASRILSTRERMGGFATIDDLTCVQGMGPKTVDALRAYVTVVAR